MSGARLLYLSSIDYKSLHFELFNNRWLFIIFYFRFECRDRRVGNSKLELIFHAMKKKNTNFNPLIDCNFKPTNASQSIILFKTAKLQKLSRKTSTNDLRPRQQGKNKHESFFRRRNLCARSISCDVMRTRNFLFDFFSALLDPLVPRFCPVSLLSQITGISFLS